MKCFFVIMHLPWCNSAIHRRLWFFGVDCRTHKQQGFAFVRRLEYDRRHIEQS